MLILFISILFIEIVTGNYEDDFEDSEEEDKKDNKVQHQFSWLYVFNILS